MDWVNSYLTLADINVSVHISKQMKFLVFLSLIYYKLIYFVSFVRQYPSQKRLSSQQYPNNLNAPPNNCGEFNSYATG